MGKRKTNQIMIIAICLLIAILAGVLQIKNWKKAEPFQLEQLFSTED
ncbi:MAG: hypothetical protein HDR21_05630 [Lachnospiraceae bacterium]|nr:hypothetical protein [Lachnospiraceae bacterium]